MIIDIGTEVDESVIRWKHKETEEKMPMQRQEQSTLKRSQMTLLMTWRRCNG